MLVLSRKINQSIMIKDNIEIVIVDIKNDQVKVGIKAPKHIPVHRKEVYEDIQRENLLASKIEKAVVERVVTKYDLSARENNRKQREGK